jgi:hypothetical protein
VKLPGGLLLELDDGSTAIERNFQFRPMTGEVELRLNELLEECRTNRDSLPLWVTRFLVVILARLGNQNIYIDDEQSLQQSMQMVRQLCITDRQFLLIQWQCLQSGRENTEWLTAHCSACKSPYDFPLDWAQLPIKPSNSHYPQFHFITEAGDEIAVRVPNGGDQEFIAQADEKSNKKLSTLLLQRLLNKDVNELSELDCVNIEFAIEEACPELAEQVSSECPECGHANEIMLDYYARLAKSADGLLDQIHLLAANYHWGEREILALPTQRRMAYLQRVERVERARISA